jgi:hypothetical protein
LRKPERGARPQTEKTAPSCTWPLRLVVENIQDGNVEVEPGPGRAGRRKASACWRWRRRGWLRSMDELLVVGDEGANGGEGKGAALAS